MNVPLLDLNELFKSTTYFKKFIVFLQFSFFTLEYPQNAYSISEYICCSNFQSFIGKHFYFLNESSALDESKQHSVSFKVHWVYSVIVLPHSSIMTFTYRVRISSDFSFVGVILLDNAIFLFFSVKKVCLKNKRLNLCYLVFWRWSESPLGYICFFVILQAEILSNKING